MNKKEILNKILNPTSKAKEEMEKLGIMTTTTDNTTNIYPNYGCAISSGVTWKFNDFSYPKIADPYEEGEEDIAIVKDNDTFTLKRKEAYRLIFILEDNGYTIETCPLEEFITILTSVRL